MIGGSSIATLLGLRIPVFPVFALVWDISTLSTGSVVSQANSTAVYIRLRAATFQMLFVVRMVALLQGQ